MAGGGGLHFIKNVLKKLTFFFLPGLGTGICLVFYSAYSYALLSNFTSRSGIESPQRLIKLICASSGSHEDCGNISNVSFVANLQFANC